MRKLCLTAAMAAMILSPACSNEPAENQQPDDGNPSVATDDEFDGKYIRTVGKHHYVAKSAHGTAIWYFQSGKKKTARTFRNGKLEGAMVMWYEDGSKKYAVNYTNNQKNGEAQGWYPDGKQMFSVDYDHGRRHGKETWYWNTGKKKYERTWYQGRNTGTKAWDKEGQPMVVPSSRPRQPIRQPGTTKSNPSSKKN